MTTIGMFPGPAAAYPKKWAGLFEAWVDGPLLCTSRQPFFDGARLLLARGMSPETILTCGMPDRPRLP
jgi:hypothetical protein